jgi:hypothetical protein
MTAMRTTFGTVILLGLIAGGCGGKGGASGSGGNTAGSGGVTGTGGVTGSGGVTSTGGAAGGTTGVGGTAAGSGGATISDAGTEGSFEPSVAGATWLYETDDVDSDGGRATGTKTVTVEKTEPVPGRSGITAWRIHTVVPGVDAQEQLTWQTESAISIVRYRDDIYAAGGTTTLVSFSVYAPAKGRVDLNPAHLTTGATYTETFTETVTDMEGGKSSTSSSSKAYTWKVINASESITVPAGTFSALHLQKLNGNSAAIDKDYWFVRGVGKVKETSEAGRTELLKSFNIP